MPEHLVVPEPFLKKGYYVYFSPNWGPEAVKGKYFEVERTHQIHWKTYTIVATGKVFSVKLDDIGLVPENPKTLYEILCGFKGALLLYVYWPSTDPFQRLEKPGFRPDPADATLRYLGCFTQDDTPFAEPRLREYTVKDMSPILYLWANESIEPEKVVNRFMVNRCLLRPLEPAEVEEIRKKRIPVRYVPHYKDNVW